MSDNINQQQWHACKVLHCSNDNRITEDTRDILYFAKKVRPIYRPNYLGSSDRLRKALLKSLSRPVTFHEIHGINKWFDYETSVYS